MFRNHARHAGLLAFVFVVPLLLASCAHTVAETADDATITARVKTALLNDVLVGALKIDVGTTQGVVTMSGTVKSRAEEARAIELARQIDGVKAVQSTLRVEN